MEVEVRYYAILRELAGKRFEKVALPEGSSVRDVIDLLVKRYGEGFERYIYDNEKRLRSYLSYMLNGININSLKGFETPLRDGDILSLLPPIGGG
ncbi:MAG: ubiquitin-like small modifier protein 1 [Candidatus Bathyarchaeia archaeon]|nr:MoaD family protein [Candidatus Bathyarchaeota archaeon]